MRALALAALAILGLAGCERTSTLYCEKHPGVCDSTVDAPVSTPCTDESCAANNDGRPYCFDMTTCGACRTNADCADPTAICDLTTHACRGCTLNSECATEVCLDSGSCAAAADVAYVGGPSATGTACTLAMPCPTVEDALGVTPPVRYIRLVGAVHEQATVTIDGTRVVDILGGGAAIDFANGGVGFDLKDQATVVMHDVEISHTNGNVGSGDDCIYLESGTPHLSVLRSTLHACDGDGIDANAGTVVVTGSTVRDCRYGIEQLGMATLTVARSTFTNNRQYAISVNVGGSPAPLTTIDASVFAFNATATDANNYAALALVGRIEMTNTIVARNGSLATTVGGIALTATDPSRFEFVTIADNITATANGKGMTCGGIVASTIANSIITGNVPSSSTFCPLTYTLTDATVAGTGNKIGAPMFDASATAATDAHFYHLLPGSAAIDAADPAATIARDIDGDARPVGMADMGADEYHP